MLDEFVFLADSPLHIALHLSRGGESIVECYILSPYIEKFCGIIVFGKFSYGTYVIVVLNSDIVVFLNIRNFFCDWQAIFSMLVSKFSIFLCSLTVFRIPLAALQSFFFCACVYFCYKTSFDSVILCPVVVLERFTKQYSHDNFLCA